MSDTQPGEPGEGGGAGTDLLDRELEELLNQELHEDGDHDRYSHYVQKEKILAPYAAWDGGFLKADQFLATVVKDLQTGPAGATAASGAPR